MSYNCDTFKVKSIKNFKIPVASLFKHDRSDWHPERINNDNGTVTFDIIDTYLNGFIENDTFHVSDIRCSGEGSGTAMRWILEPAFKDSTGELIASCVWEAGDSVNRLTVKDGDVSWEDIEI